MGRVLRTNGGAMAIALAEKTRLALSKIGLFKSGIVIDETTPLAAIIAAEADFSGYAQATVTAMLAPLLDPAGGASIESGTVQFGWVTDDPEVANEIAGWFHVTAAGVLVSVGVFTDTVNFAGAGQGLPLNVKYLFAAG